MGKILQSKDKFDSLALLDLDSGQMTIVSKKDRPDLAFERKHGFYSEVDGKKVCLYVDSEKLFIMIDDQLIELSEGTKVRLESIDEKRNLFTIFQGHEKVFTWKYEKPEKERFHPRDTEGQLHRFKTR